MPGMQGVQCRLPVSITDVNSFMEAITLIFHDGTG